MFKKQSLTHRAGASYKKTGRKQLSEDYLNNIMLFPATKET